ncbi:AgmX/PglI C-terminal domain-containing protein [bacterium]|nr:AgmX/PglI C-terminal domain-containing protein [bacterium]
MKKVLVIVTVIVIIALFASYKCSRSRGAENVETTPATVAEPEPAPAVEEAPAQNEEPSEEVKEEPAPAKNEEPAAAPEKEPKKEVRKAKPAAEKAEKAEKMEKPAAEKETPKAQPVEKKPVEREEKPVPGSPSPALNNNREPADANIDSAGVMKVISVSRAAIKRCYDKALISNPQLKGKMSVKIVINQQGRVDKTEIVDDTLHDAEVAKCVKGVIGRLRFPKPAEGSATVTFPFSFDPKNQ